MNNLYLIYRLFALLCISSFFFSCDDAKEDNLTPNSVYLVHSGVQELEMYDKGEGTSYTYVLALYKSGALKNAASVRIAVMTDEELTAYNQENGTNFEILAREVYNIEKYEVLFTDDQKDVNGTINIDFDPAKLAPTDLNKVLPIKIIDTSVSLNKEKSICIIHPQTKTPTFNIEFPQVKVINYKKGEQSVLELNISALLDIDENPSEVDVEVEIDGNYITQYNLSNGEDYIVPDANEFSIIRNKTLQSGEKNISFDLKIFQQYLTRNYMLPIHLKTSSKYAVNKDGYYVLILNVLPELLPRETWTISDFNTQETLGEGSNGRAYQVIDGDYNTYWHSQWKNGLAPLPHYVVIDMQKTVTIRQIDLVRRKSYDHAKAGEFLISDNNITWQKIGDFTLAKTDNPQEFTTKRGTGRYLKVNITQSNHWDNVTSLAEVMPRGY